MLPAKSANPYGPQNKVVSTDDYKANAANSVESVWRGPNAVHLPNHVEVRVSATRLADEIIAALAADPNAEVNVSFEIQATFPNGAQDDKAHRLRKRAHTRIQERGLGVRFTAGPLRTAP